MVFVFVCYSQQNYGADSGKIYCKKHFHDKVTAKNAQIWSAQYTSEQLEYAQIAMLDIKIKSSL